MIRQITGRYLFDSIAINVSRGSDAKFYQINTKSITNVQMNNQNTVSRTGLETCSASKHQTTTESNVQKNKCT